MSETTRTSPCPNALRQTLRNRLTACALVAMSIFALVPAIWASPFSNSELAAALSTKQSVSPEAEELANNFVDRTLPRLLLDDVRLAKQLGFGDTTVSTVVLDQTLPIMILYRKNVLTFIQELNESAPRAQFDRRARSRQPDKSTQQTGPDPFTLINNTDNWIKDRDGRLIPRRSIFSIKVNDGTFDSESRSRSSVTLEHSSDGRWRVSQVGAPKLARAMRLYEDPQSKHFLLWIPDLNRHYLGQIGPVQPDPTHHSIILTVLFDDPLLRRSAGEQIDITSPEFIERIKTFIQMPELQNIMQGRTTAP
jgi:hypothetical protein